MILVLFAVLIIALAIGVPVSFSIALSAFVFLLVGDSAPMTVLIAKMQDGVSSFSLLALPLFVLSGDLMAYGCTPRLMRLANLLVKRIPGGLACTGVVSSALFGTVSGSGVATTAAIGSIVEPEMIRNGYGKGFTASIMAGAGTLGTVIPPSIPLVIYATTCGVSIGKMFMAGVIPGIISTVLLCLLSIIIAKKRGYKGMVSFDGKSVRKIILDALLPLLMPVFVLGSVLAGICTATESASIAVVYSFILAVFVYKELKLKDLYKVISKALVSSASILLIMAVAEPFGWVLTTNNVPTIVSNALTSFTSSGVLMILLISALLLFLGTFMETISIIILTAPMLLAVMQTYGMDPIHFGIIMKLALSVGGCTPPLAVCLFTSCRIVDARVDETFPDILYVCGFMTISMLIGIFFPQLSLWLPSLMK